MTQRGFIDGEYQDGELRGCTFIAGQRGMGKTTEMGRLLSLCLGGVVFFDPLAKHAQLLPGCRVISQPGDLEAYLRLNRGRRFRAVYQPMGGDLDGHFRAVCTIVRAFGWLIFAVDELDMFCGARWGDKRMPQEFYDLVHYGRHYHMSMLATARRPMDVARGYTSQCLSMRLFYMRERNDLKYFEDYVGREEVARVAALDKYQFLHWTGDGPAQLCGGARAGAL